MADPGKSSDPNALGREAGGALSDSDMGSFPPVQANPGSPLDEVAEPYSTHMTRQDLSTHEEAPPDNDDTRHTLTGDADADANDATAPSPPLPPRERSAESARPGDGAAPSGHGSDSRSKPASSSGSSSPKSDDPDALTFAQLIEARVIDAPDEPARQRGAIGVLDKRYELRRKLGEGGMGIVFLAFDRLGDCEVAVKTLRPKFLSDSESRKRFIDEAKQMNKVPSHAHVLVVKGFGTENRPYYVMENMSGGSLGKLIRKEGPLPRDQALRLATDIAKAIEYLHESSGQIHRDIKPENVLLAKDGSAWLCDFGLIRQVGIGATGLRAGTLAYMPPEVVTDLTKNVAFDWDIYSFGAVLYEMICGKRPYDELFNTKTNPLEQMKLMKEEVTRRPPKPIFEVCRKADPSLAKISQWCMARDPRERYFRIADVLKDLRRIGENKLPLGPRQNAIAAAGKSPAMRAVAALLFLFIAAGAWVWFANPYNLRQEILIALGVEDRPKTPGNGTPTTDKNITTVTDGGAPITVDTDPVVPNAPIEYKTGSAILDAVNREGPIKVSVTTVPNRAIFLEEEIMSVEVRYDRPCFIIVLFISLDHPDEPVTLLFPNRWQTSDKLPPPKTPLLIPSETARSRDSVVIRIVPPHGRNIVKVIASNPPLIMGDGENHLQEGFALLDAKNLKVWIAGQNEKQAEKIEDLLKPEQWSTVELLVTTKEK